jgi:hypothetical protein
VSQINRLFGSLIPEVDGLQSADEPLPFDFSPVAYKKNYFFFRPLILPHSASFHFIPFRVGFFLLHPGSVTFPLYSKGRFLWLIPPLWVEPQLYT